MFLDPIFRFNWIFYIIYTKELQHSAILSFLVGFSEISRRGMWTLFRVENEHCTNVGRFRASRDVPLPYDIASTSTSTLNTPDPSTDANAAEHHADTKKHKRLMPANGRDGLSSAHQQPTSRSHASSGADLERAATADTASSNLRQRRGNQQDATPVVQRGIARVGTMMAEAHAQDFERKRRPSVTGGGGGDDGKNGIMGSGEVSSDDEYGEEIEEDHEHAQDVHHVEGLLERHRSGTVGEEGGIGHSGS